MEIRLISELEEMGKVGYLFYTFLVAHLATITYGDKDGLLVTLEEGRIAGVPKQSYYGRYYSSFEGIPFAAPPIGANRFKDPQPVERWNDVIEANKSYSCSQLGYTGPYGTEDCLYLNVYTPLRSINGTENLDVIVHIHGGAFMMGNGYDLSGPSKLMDKDVVYVTLNYRLGPLGFLATEDNTFSGNYGLKDQVMALRWVQKDIKLFGGNPNSVTLIGVSAGAASVHLHFFKKNTSEVLFHKAWAESGSALDPWAVRERTRPESAELIKSLGCNQDGVAECMRNKSVDDIIRAVGSFYSTGNLVPATPFGPVVEKENDKNPNPFLVRHPYDQLKEGQTLKIPFVISEAMDEGLIPSIVFYNRIEELNEKMMTLLPKMLEYYDLDGVDQQNEISKKIMDFYFQNATISRGNFDLLVKVCTQRLFHMGAEKSAKLTSKVSTSNVYVMLFGYDGSNKVFKRFFNATDLDGVMHAEEAIYLYDTKFPGSSTLTKLDGDDERMQKILVDLVVSFARTGVPSTENITWDPVSKEGDLKYLLIKNPDEIAMDTKNELGAYAFWSSLNISHNIYDV